MVFDETGLKLAETAPGVGVDNSSGDADAEYLLFSEGKAQSCNYIGDLVKSGMVIDIYSSTSANPSRQK